MRTYSVTEVEKEDWDNLRLMSLDEALEITKSDTFIRGYLGSYSYGSKEEYDFDKAKIYKAIKVLSDYVENNL